MRDEVTPARTLDSRNAGASLTGGPGRVRAPLAGRRLLRASLRAPTAIVLVAFVARIAVVAADTGYHPANDAWEYDHIARSIAAGDGYPRSGYLLQGGPTAVRGPGYPFLMGAVYIASDDSRAAARVLNAALGALTVLLTFLLAKRIWGRRTGLVAAAFAAVFPPLVLLSRDLVAESLFIPLILAALLCVLNFRRSGGGLRWAAAAGGLCGVAILTRNTGVVLLVPAVIGVWTGRPRLTGTAVRAPLLAVACAAVVVAPWVVRNSIAFDRLVPPSTASGISASGTYNSASFRDSDSHGAWRDPQIVPGFTNLFVTPGIDEAEVDARLRRAAELFAWQHPGYVAETFGWNLMRMFELAGGSVVDFDGTVLNDRGIGSADPPAERIGLGVAVLLAVVALLAMFRFGLARRSQGDPARLARGPWFLWLTPILMILAAALFAGLPRYRLPADPFLLILAAIGLCWLWDRFSPRGRIAA